MNLSRSLCLLAVAGTVLLAACGDDDDPSPTLAEKEDDSTRKTDNTTTTTATTQPEVPDEPVPNTIDGAVGRFEEFLDALGRGDVDTLCEIAGPAAQRAEDEGFGPCEDTYGSVVDMISDEQAAALEGATVDTSLVQEIGFDEVRIPVEAVVADVAFSEDDLGSYRLRYQDGNWFIVG